MTEQTPLERYTEAKRILNAFEADYEELFRDYRNLQQAVTDADSELRTWARDNGPTENDHFTVTVQYKTRKWYDADKILELAPEVRNLKGVVVETIDKSKIEALAKGGMIDAAIAKKAYREEPMTPAVSIKPRVT
jgi:hypothetical protein